MKTGLLMGRFQPFHLGHLSAVKQALKVVDKLYIGIGSSQYSHGTYNPFTGKERMEMVKRALRENELSDRCEVFLIPDIHDDAKWTAHVRSIVAAFDIVFVGNNGLVKELFEKHDKAKVIKVKQELDISATKIRTAVLHGTQWEKNLSPSTVHYLKKIDGTERIRQAQFSDQDLSDSSAAL